MTSTSSPTGVSSTLLAEPLLRLPHLVYLNAFSMHPSFDPSIKCLASSCLLPLQRKLLPFRWNQTVLVGVFLNYNVCLPTRSVTRDIITQLALHPLMPCKKYLRFRAVISQSPYKQTISVNRHPPSTDPHTHTQPIYAKAARIFVPFTWCLSSL